MGLARELATRVAAMQYSDLSEAAIHWGRVAVLDTIGCTLAGAKEDAPRLLDEVMGLPDSGASLVFGSTRRASALDAAVINGTAAHALDFDNTLSNMGGHVSAVLVPALIAAAEAGERSGRDVLLAHAAGFETARIGLGINPQHSDKGWHPTATVGVFAVTAACARLLGLSVDQTETALGLATSLAAGIKANFGTMTKPLHAGQCARSGLLAAMLAAKGFTANREAFEHKQGFFALFAPGQHDVSRILEGWGGTLDIESPGASYKLYPCCYSTHSAVEAALKIVGRHGRFDPGEVVRVQSRTSGSGLVHTDRPQPRGGLEAKFSVQYCVARALLDGKVVLEHFDGEAYRAPDVQAFLAKVQALPHEGAPGADDRFKAELEVTLSDGTVLKEEVARPLGRSAANPIPDDDIEAKFMDCASRTIPEAAARALCEKLWTLESAASIRELTSLLESSAPDVGGVRLKPARAPATAS